MEIICHYLIKDRYKYILYRNNNLAIPKGKLNIKLFI